MFISGGGDSDLYAVMARTGGPGLDVYIYIYIYTLKSLCDMSHIF